jgi:hypothetical protein
MRSRFIPAVLLLAVAQAAFAQVQLIQNGWFESTSQAPWVLSGTGVGIVSGTNANGGFGYDGDPQYLSMGNSSGQVQTASQTITFPTNLIGATLSLYYQTVSTDPAGDDLLEFDIVDANNNLVMRLAYTYSAYPTSAYTYGYAPYTTNFISYTESGVLSSYAGETVKVLFYVETDSTNGSLTSFDIDDVSLVAGTTADIPSNDNFTNATPILSSSISEDVNTTYASKETGEPNHAGNAGGHSLWWTWAAPSIGTVSINTTDGSFDTLLAVYTGSTLTALTNVTSDDGINNGSGMAGVAFNVLQPGTVFHIALDGYNGQSGSAVFNFSFSPDKTIPTVAFTSPKAGADVTNSTVVVQGTADDNVDVAAVYYRLENAAGTNAYAPATILSNSAGANAWSVGKDTAAWEATVTNLIPGPNTVRIEAVDTSSNVATVTRVFNNVTPAPLALATNGRGAISISGAAAIASPTNGQLLDVGYTYVLTAKAAAGFAFTNWTGSIETNSKSVSFIMAPDLSFTANFVDVEKPTLSVTLPTANERWSNSSLFQIAGKAADNVAVSNVLYQFDGGNWTQATPSNGTWSNWRTDDVTLTTGLNTVRAYAVDTSGNISTNTNIISFYYIVALPLVVQTNTLGRGTISPDYNNRSLVIKSNYVITATAAAGFKFTNWTGGTNPPYSVLTNNARLSFQMETNLTLIANFVDVTPPSVTVTSPAAGQRWSNSTFTAAGTAKDNVQVSNVFCQLNSNGWTPATNVPGDTNWAHWTATLTNLESTNLFEAYSVAITGNISPTNKVTFFYIPSATLAVTNNGNGKITPVDNGRLLAIGTNYTLTASAGHDWIFSNWVASGSTNFVSNSPKLTFTMQSNLALAANFVTNVFLAAQGTYNGLFAPANAPRQQTNSGAITLSVTSTGALSGKLTLGTNTPSLTGQFDPAGVAAITTPRKGQSNLITTLQLDFAGQTVAGSVTDGSFVAQVIADLDVFNSTRKATNYEGHYTFIIPGTNDPGVGPLGTSCGTVTVSPSGAVTFTVSLADGTTAPVNPSSVVSKDGWWPFYLPLYSGNGSLWSWNGFTNVTNGVVIFSTNASWINATNASKTAQYRAGFTNETASILGSAFNPTNEPLLALSNGQVTLQDTNWPTITNQLTLASNNAITLTNAADTNKLALTINKTNGVISGAFVNPANSKQTLNISGVLLQNETNAQGCFIGTNQNGTFLLVPQ